MLLALFEPNDELTAVFRLAGIVLWVASAFTPSRVGARFLGLGGATGLLALGLAVFFFSLHVAGDGRCLRAMR